MKRKILVALGVTILGVALAAILWVVPAGAHNFDNQSLFSCAWGRDNGSQQVVHSYPVQLGNGWVEYHCRAKQYHAGVLVADVHYYVFLDLPSTFTKPWPSGDCMNPAEVCAQYPW